MTNEVLLKLTCSYLPLLNQMIKYNAAINQTYLRVQNGNVYIEEIEDGLLYIFKDLVSFQQMHTPLPKFSSDVEKKLRSIDQNEELLILGNELQSPDKFPPNGIQYYLSSESHSAKELFPYLNAFYRSVHPSIEVYEKDAQMVVVDFPVYEAARRNFEISYYFGRAVFTPSINNS